MTDDIAKKVAEIIAEQAMVEPETISDTTTVEDLGLDSLALVEVVFGIEDNAFIIAVSGGSGLAFDDVTVFSEFFRQAIYFFLASH